MNAAGSPDGFAADPALDRLLGAARASLAACPIGDPARHEVDAVLAGWPRRLRPAAGRPGLLPACAHLAAALRLGAAAPAAALCAAAAALRDRLGWSYSYPPEPRWPDLPSTVAFAQIVGRRGLCDDDTVHLGLTLLAPHTHYPLHAHPAIELYLVLGGTASWRIAGQPFRRHPPGSLILHESGVGHAMATADEPLLALYTWRGDLVTAPRYVAD